jgi:hypothetical protein
MRQMGCDYEDDVAQAYRSSARGDCFNARKARISTGTGAATTPLKN